MMGPLKSVVTFTGGALLWGCAQTDDSGQRRTEVGFDSTPQNSQATGTPQETEGAVPSPPTPDWGTGTPTSSGPSQGAGQTEAGTDDDAGPTIRFDTEPEETDSVGNGDGGECECVPNSDLIYLLSDDAQLWRFDPEAVAFEDLGPLDCANPSNAAYAMGLDRQARAWVQFIDTHDIYVVDLVNGRGCTKSGYDPSTSDFGLMGLSFSSRSQMDPCEDLYGLDLESFSEPWNEGYMVGKLGVFDENLEVVSEVGPTDFEGGDLSGTGDGRLFAFAGATGVPPKLIEYDKSDGSEISVHVLDDLQRTFAIALTFWGGDFYIFTEVAGFGTNSKVTVMDVDGSDGEPFALSLLTNDVPLRAIAAATSTCAPIRPPG